MIGRVITSQSLPCIDLGAPAIAFVMRELTRFLPA
jgi:hypothetical protein